MRFLIDTNIFIFYATDADRLTRDVLALLDDWSNTIYISAASARGLVIGYGKRGFDCSRWKTCEELVRSIEDEFHITIKPVAKEHMLTYSRLRVNEAQGHNDPSDHVIISHAITEGLPLISSDSRFPFYREQGLELIQNKR